MASFVFQNKLWPHRIVHRTHRTRTFDLCKIFRLSTFSVQIRIAWVSIFRYCLLMAQRDGKSTLRDRAHEIEQTNQRRSMRQNLTTMICKIRPNILSILGEMFTLPSFAEPESYTNMHIAYNQRVRQNEENSKIYTDRFWGCVTMFAIRKKSEHKTNASDWLTWII